MNRPIEILSRDPIMKTLIAKHGELTLTKGNDYFESLARSIIGQQLSVKAANSIYKRVLALVEDEFSAERITLIPDDTLRQAGLSKNKINYIKNLATAVINKKIDFEAISKSDDEDVIRQLTTLKGIGRWTAEMFLIFCLARKDVYSLGDGGLNNAINNLYGKDEALTIDQIKAITDKWQPYRSIASLYLWRSLDNK